MNKYICERSLTKNENETEHSNTKEDDALFEKLSNQLNWDNNIIDYLKYVDYNRFEAYIAARKFQNLKKKITWHDLEMFNNLDFLDHYYIEFEISKEFKEFNVKLIDRVNDKTVIMILKYYLFFKLNPKFTNKIKSRSLLQLLMYILIFTIYHDKS